MGFGSGVGVAGGASLMLGRAGVANLTMGWERGEGAGLGTMRRLRGCLGAAPRVRAGLPVRGGL